MFFGDTYGTEISQDTNFAANVRLMITSWILLSERSVSNWMAEDIITVQAKFAIEDARNS